MNLIVFERLCSFFFYFTYSLFDITNYTFCFSLVEFFINERKCYNSFFIFSPKKNNNYDFNILYFLFIIVQQKIRSLEISDSIKQKKLCLIWSFLITVLNSHAIHFFVLLSLYELNFVFNLFATLFFLSSFSSGINYLIH